MHFKKVWIFPLSKATSSLFLSEMIVKLGTTFSTASNTYTKTPTNIGSNKNNKSTTADTFFLKGVLFLDTYILETQSIVIPVLRFKVLSTLLVARNLSSGGLRTTLAQTSLCIRAVWSAPLLFAFWKVSYLDLLRAKFQFSSWSL